MYLKTIEMPFYLKIDSGVINNLSKVFEETEDRLNKVLLVSGKITNELFGKLVYNQIKSYFKEVVNLVIESNHIETSFELAREIIHNDINLVVGVGGGKVLDVCKYAAFMSKKRFISIPTAIAHDGIASPIAVLQCKDNQVKSLGCKVPSAIIIDLNIISKAPTNLIKAGIGDTLSNLIAVKDWKLANEKGKEKINDFALLLSSVAIESILNYKKKDIKDINFIRQVTESLVISGLAMNIAGSSRPCSGSEHLISHAMDKLNKKNLHGIQVAISSIISSYLYKEDYNRIVKFLKLFDIPTTLQEINISYEDYIFIMENARSTRPNRYTILDEVDLSRKNLKKIYDDLFRE